MSTTEEKQEKIALEMAATASKSALVEKITSPAFRSYSLASSIS